MYATVESTAMSMVCVGQEQTGRARPDIAVWSHVHGSRGSVN
jgi:hypothetical protein